jgi:hypothetical protein
MASHPALLVASMTSRTCRRFPEQRLTREEALKGMVHFQAPLRVGFLIRCRNDVRLRMGLIQREHPGINYTWEACGLRRAVEGHHDYSSK